MSARTSSLLLVVALSACRGAPQSMGVALSPDPAYTTDDLVLAAELSPEDEPRADRLDISIRWTVDGAEQADLADLSTVPSERTAKGQLWEATAVALRGDRAGEAAIAQVTIANSLPTAEATLDAEVPSDRDLMVTATATDADDDAISFSWSWTRDGDPTDFAEAPVPASATSRDERWEVTVTPFDGEASGEPVVLSTLIANLPPVVTELTLSPDAVFADSLLQAHAVASDPDGDPVSLEYSWLVDGVVVQTGAVDSLDGALFDKHQEVEVHVTPSDDTLAGDTVIAGPIAVLNSPPSLSEVSIDPAARSGDVNAECLATGWSDIDGDPEGVRYLWTVNGVEAGTNAVLGSALFGKGDTLVCVATPFDGEDEGPALTSDPIVVLNTAPQMQSAAISPATAHTDDTLSTDLSATDVDGDAVSYRYSWTVNGAAAGTEATLASDLFQRDDIIGLAVTPFDGDLEGAPMSADPVTIANSPPSIAAVMLFPTSPTEGAPVRCLPEGWTDADGDPEAYTYQWTVNGAEVATTADLEPSFFVEGDALVCTVTPSDGLDTGPAVASDASVVLPGCHPADPVWVEGFTRNYAVTTDLAASGTPSVGTESQTGLGYSLNFIGAPYYAVSTTLDTPGDAFTATAYYQCEAGEALVVGWVGDASLNGQPRTLDASLDPGRVYLPTVDALNAGATWTYSYDLLVDAGFPLTIPTTGSYTALPGKEPITVPAGTFSAWKITHDFTQSRASGSFNQLADLEATATYWYVEGLGLVKEQTVDAVTGGVVMSKELTSYSGLAPR